MKSTIKMAEGLAIGMIVGGVAWAVISAKMKSKPDVKKMVGNAVKSACDFIGDICS